MAKPEWGTKRRCLNCSAAFYDLGKSPILCPKCGTEHNPDALVKTRRPARVEEVKAVKAPLKPVVDDAVVGDDEDAVIGDDILEDADEFEEEDVAEEIDVDAEPDEER